MFNDFTKEELAIIEKHYKKAAAKEITVRNNLSNPIFNKLLEKELIQLSKGKAKFTSKAKTELNHIFGVSKPKPTKKKLTATKLAPSSAKLTLQSIDEYFKPMFESLESRIKNLENLLNKNPQTTVQVTMAIPTFQFQKFLKEKYDKINSSERRGGMVPIPKLWDEMIKENISRTQFEDDLFELEKKQVIELQSASDPNLVKERDKAIQHPSRGLINYVIWRR